MKKIFILIPILALFMMGCSLKQKPVVNSPVSSQPVAIVSPSEDALPPSIVENVKESESKSITNRRDSGLKDFKCSDEPVKVTDLMVGDTIDSYAITKISDTEDGNGSLGNYGYIGFSGEKILTGRLIVREKNLGWEPIYFQPDSQSLMPNVYLKDYRIESEKGIDHKFELQLRCSDSRLILETDTSSSGEIGAKFDFPAISKMIPDFPDFWAKAGTEKGKDSEYLKKVVIKVNNINSSWVLNGDYNTRAHLVEIIKVIE